MIFQSHTQFAIFIIKEEQLSIDLQPKKLICDRPNTNPTKSSGCHEAHSVNNSSVPYLQAPVTGSCRIQVFNCSLLP